MMRLGGALIVAGFGMVAARAGIHVSDWQWWAHGAPIFIGAILQVVHKEQENRHD